jgi:hypothetical protein
MDACNFQLLASRYAPVDEIRPLVAVEGDPALAEQALAKTWAPY